MFPSHRRDTPRKSDWILQSDGLENMEEGNHDNQIVAARNA